MKYALAHGSELVVAPATPQQEWELLGSPEGEGNVNLAIAWRIRGPLRVEAMQRALDEIFRRHEVLRTRLVVVRDEVMQAIAPRVDTSMRFVDLRRLRAARRGRELAVRAASELQRPFQLTEAPLIRVILVRTGEREHVLLVIVCHAIWDGASSSVFIRELGLIYEALGSGRPSPLPDLSIQIGDLAGWQREQAAAAAVEARSGANARAHLDDGTRKPHVVGAICTRAVGTTVLRDLHALAQRSGSTAAVVMLAALVALVRARRRDSTVRVALATSNRESPEVRALIGLVAGGLPLDVAIEADPSFPELVRRTHEAVGSAYATGDAIAPLVTSRLGWPGGMSPIAPVSLNVIPPDLVADAPMHFGSLVVQRYQPATWWAAFPVDTVWQYGRLDVTVLMSQRGDRAHARVAFNRTAVEPEAAVAFGRDYINALRVVACNPRRRLSELIARVDALARSVAAGAPALTADAGLVRDHSARSRR